MTSHNATYEITPSALHDAMRLHMTRFTARFRVVMLIVVLVGIMVRTRQRIPTRNDPRH